MLTTLSRQGGRRYPQMGSTGLPWAGPMASVGEVVALVVPPATINYQGDGKGSAGRKKRRNRTYELFAEMERTIWTELTGPVVVEAPPLGRLESPVVVDVSKGYDYALDQLLATAGEYQELSRRVAVLRTEISAYQSRTRQMLEDDDEETWLLM